MGLIEMCLCFAMIDLISCHPSPQAHAPHSAAAGHSGDNSRAMDWPVNHLVLLWRSHVHVCGQVAVFRLVNARAEGSSVSWLQMGSCPGHSAVKWKACHSLFRLMASDCERLCHVLWLLTRWLGTLRQKPEPVWALCVLTEKCVFHFS